MKLIFYWALQFVNNLPHLLPQDWEQVALQTLERQTLSELNWILYSSTTLYTYWQSVCEAYLDGELLGSDGNEGKKHKSGDISVGMFKCFEGDLAETQLMKILEKLMDGRCLMKKDANYKGDLPSIEELAKTAKFFKALKPRIHKYLFEKFPDHFSKETTWNQICHKLPELKEDKEMNRLKVICGEQYVSALTAKNKKEPAMPNNLQSALNVFVAIHFEVHLRERKVPFLVGLTKDLGLTLEPRSILDENPTCNLAIVDFARRDVRPWSVEELKTFFRWIATYTRSAVISVAIFVRPDVLHMNVLTALHEIKDYYVHLEFGSYAGPENRYRDPKMIMRDQREIIIMAGIASDSKNDWQSTFSQLKGLHFTFDDGQDKDFRTSFPSEYIPEKETREEKDARLAEERIVALQCQAPRYDILGDNMLGTWVNPDCKSHKVIENLIRTMTPRGETVLDFFSGGQVLKESLLVGRECIAFSDTPKEQLFLESYVHLLREIPQVDKFWIRVEKIHKGEKIVDDQSFEHLQLQQHGDNQDEEVVVYKFDPSSATKEAGSISLEALGLFVVEQPSSSAAPPTTAQHDVEVPVEGEQIQEEGVVATNTIVATEPPMERAQVIGEEQGQLAEGNEDDLPLGVVNDFLGNDEAVAEGGDEVVDNLLHANTIGSTTEVHPDVQTGTDEASAHLPSSPNISNYSSLSNSISQFSQKRFGLDVGTADEYGRLDEEFLHYVWVEGPRKGQALNPNHAEKLLGLDTFRKERIEVVYNRVPPPVHADSQDIQNILGKTKVDEYGTFVKRS